RLPWTGALWRPQHQRLFRVATVEFAGYSPAANAVPVNKPRVLVRTSLLAARVPAATARTPSRNTKPGNPTADKVPRKQSYQRPDESCQLMRSDYSHPR